MFGETERPSRKGPERNHQPLKAVGKAFSVKWPESNRVGWQESMMAVTWGSEGGTHSSSGDFETALGSRGKINKQVNMTGPHQRG